MRRIIRDEENSYAVRVTRLQEYVTEIGLQIPEKPTALQPVRIEDIRVVCWMAVTPKLAG